jgi:SagB-type dehydrogenase family enzyme
VTALERLRPPGEAEDRLTELVARTDGPAAVGPFRALLRRLARQGLLLRSACLEGERLATLTPLAPAVAFAQHALPPEGRCVLSRFAYLRRQAGEMVLECPLGAARITLHDWRATGLVHALARPHRAADLAGQVAGLPAEAVGGLMTLLSDARAVWQLGDEGGPPEDEGALQAWEFHDLLFHARSRAGRHDYPAGATYRFAGRVPPPPVLKPTPPGEKVALYCPDLDRLQREDPPFAWVQEARRSVRAYAARPLSDRQLGEFLYRVGHVSDYREEEVATPAGPVPMAYAPRPYPAGGGLYELELYAAVNACENLAPGLYHYDPAGHQLHRLSGRTAAVERLLADAGRATAIPPERLQVLIVLAARFPRITWKYASIAYALVLKHVGVLYQTMYLVAAAMGLAPCAVGLGNADLFARAAGTDYYAETSVGEFLLGSRA